MANKFALDTNVLIYLHDNSRPDKRAIASDLLAENPSIPSQVISEYLNTTRRLLTLSKHELLIQAAELFTGCVIIPTVSSTLFRAATLVKKYDFQLFDAMVVALSIEGGCERLYTEDMHHGLVVDKSLKILNPFL